MILSISSVPIPFLTSERASWGIYPNLSHPFSRSTIQDFYYTSPYNTFTCKLRSYFININVQRSFAVSEGGCFREESGRVDNRHVFSFQVRLVFIKGWWWWGWTLSECTLSRTGDTLDHHYQPLHPPLGHKRQAFKLSYLPSHACARGEGNLYLKTNVIIISLTTPSWYTVLHHISYDNIGNYINVWATSFMNIPEYTEPLCTTQFCLVIGSQWVICPRYCGAKSEFCVETELYNHETIESTM